MHKHHIIPKHAGGSKGPTIEVTIEEHANIHKELYEKHGRWQDKIAWKGLSKQIGREEIQREICRQVGLLPKSKESIEKRRKWLKENFVGEGNPMHGKTGYWAGKVGPNKGKKRPAHSSIMKGENNPNYKNGKYVKSGKI